MARTCKVCGKAIPSMKQSNQLERNRFCDFPCLNDHGRAKAQEAKDKKARAKHKADKERIMTRSQWVSKAQEYVNRVVVLEDKDKGCISCSDGPVTDAGHFFHRGTKYRTARLTLSRINLNGQCRSCNSFKGGGNQYEYRLGFIERYGLEAFEELEELKLATDRGEVPELTIEDCKVKIEWAKARLKELRNNS